MIPDLIKKLIDSERSVINKLNFLRSLKPITVSKVATIAGSTYESIRNAIDLEQDHLLRRRAIKRILLRVGALGSGKPVDIAEDMIKEIIWGSYVNKLTVPEIKIEESGKIINKYQTLVTRYHNKYHKKVTTDHALDLYDIMSFEIERNIFPYDDKDALINLQYYYLAPLKLVRSADLPEEFENIQTYISTMKSVTKFDTGIVKYYMFANAFPNWTKPSDTDITNMVTKLVPTLNDIHKHTTYKLMNKKSKEFIRQSIPLKILNSVIEDNIKNAEEILSSKEKRDEEVRIVCDREYSNIQKKLRSTIIKMIIYLALTKMVFAFIVEVPYEGYIHNWQWGTINYIPLAINILFPPILMALIASSFRIPYRRNTQAIIEMIDRYMDPTKVRYYSDGMSRDRNRPFLYFIFQLFSNIIFLGVIVGISYVLKEYIEYNYISIGIFILFLSLISFAALRTRNVATELIVVPIKSNIFTPLIDMIATPILDVGKRLSEGVSRFSPLPFLFDYILESPYKGIIRIFEEWNTFIKERKEEIV